MKHDKIVLLAETTLTSKDVLISNVLLDSYIIHDEFVSLNNVLGVYDNMKEEIKKFKASTVHQRF